MDTMKRILVVLAMVLAPLATWAQATFNNVHPSTTKNDSVFIIITDDNVFSRCFTKCDLNGDNKVSYAEAAMATTLHLDYGGRMNIIGNYSFLQFFPNLTHLSIGNTPNESIDLSGNPKLEVIDLRGGLWITEVTLAMGCNPQIFFPIHNQPVTFKRVSK